MTTALRAKPDVLYYPPKYLRSPVATSKALRVDRNGGYDGAGAIYGASVITRGEAEGHYMWIDSEFNAAVAQHMNSAKRGTKMRFTHPSLSGDGLGSFLGRAMNATQAGKQVLADLHFSKTAHNTPDGDLASYVMDLAENDPEAFGMSIVFRHDRGAEDKHRANNENEDGDFKSPDSENKSNLPHARLQILRAVDVVDTPAANPSGLFHQGHEFAAEADSLAMFALGLSDERPATGHLSIDAERLASFTDRFLEQHGLTIVREDKSMLTEQEQLQSQIDAAVKAATDKLSADNKSALEKLATDHAAEIASLKGVNPPKKDAEPTVDELLAAERTRVKELHALASNAGIKEQATIDRWVDKKLSVLEAKAEIGELAIKSGKLVKSDASGDEPNKERAAELAARAEYREHAKLHASLGYASEDDYVKTRKPELLAVA
jgi:hypothetical protein